MLFAFASDFHLGEGEALEDFADWSGRIPRRKTPKSLADPIAAMHARWSAFLDALLAQSAAAHEPAELILLGDVFDLLQVQGSLCAPEKIEQIARAHTPWFQALARAAAEGLSVSLVVGNHDHELLDPAVWAALRARLPFLNERQGSGAPLALWRHPEAGIHAEHGSQFDPFNAVEEFGDPRALSLGSHLVLGLINAFEPRCPLLDLMPGAAAALWYALAHAPGLMAAPLRRFLFGPAEPSGECAANLDFLPELENLLRRVWLPHLPLAHQIVLREALALIAEAISTPQAAEPAASTDAACSPAAICACAAAVHPMIRIEERLAAEAARLTPSRLRSIPEEFARNSGGAPLRLLITAHTHRASIPPETADKEMQSKACENVAAAQPPTGARGKKGNRKQGDQAADRPGVRTINTGSWKARARPLGRSRFAIEQSFDFVILSGSDPLHPEISLHTAPPVAQ